MAPTIFFLFNILTFIYFFEYETIETHALSFLTLIILAIGRLNYDTMVVFIKIHPKIVFF